MFSLLIWSIYGIIVGSIAKSIVPGNENFGLFTTITLGVIGSYFGGAMLYLFNKTESLSSSGIVMGTIGAIIAILVFKKFHKQ